MLPSDPGFRALFWATLWLVGLFVSLMTGMLSGYLVASVVFVGGKAYRRLRSLSAGERGGDVEARKIR
ncbi:MAG: hypothetical protein R3304_08955 [Longimicrobiales bacterium]|nr:hypothetical protein [Longimicrobiales bacterium]